MARHPDTEGNDLQPNRVDAKEDVTVPDGSGGRLSVGNIETDFSEKVQEVKSDTEKQIQEIKSDTLVFSEGFAPGFLG